MKALLPILFFLIFVSTIHGRTWINKDGQKFEGNLKDIEENIAVILRTPDQTLFRIPILELSEADQNYINKHIKAAIASGKRLPQSKEELAAWIIGTEWRLTDENHEHIIRFLPDGVIDMQSKTKKWNKGYPGTAKEYFIVK